MTAKKKKKKKHMHSWVVLVQVQCSIIGRAEFPGLYAGQAAAFHSGLHPLRGGLPTWSISLGTRHRRADRTGGLWELVLLENGHRNWGCLKITIGETMMALFKYLTGWDWEEELACARRPWWTELLSVGGSDRDMKWLSFLIVRTAHQQNRLP